MIGKKDSALRARLAELRQRYVADLDGRVGSAEALWSARRGRDLPPPPEQLKQLRHVAHGIAGSGATFGFDALSTSARALELRVDALLDGSDTSVAALDATEALVAQLRVFQVHMKEEEPPPVEGAHVLPDQPTEPTPPPGPARSEERLLVYLLDDEPAAAEGVAAQLEHFGYDVKTFGEPAALLERLRSRLPAALITDIRLPASGRGGIDLARQVRQEHGDRVPILFMSVLGDIATRLAAVRAGGRAYLQKPVHAGRLVDSLDTLTHRHPISPYRVLIVENDSHEAELYRSVLSGAGFEVAILHGAQGILSTLTDFRPEVILLDLYLDDCTGFELAAVIRQQTTSVGVPIIYLSAELDAGRQLDAIAQGGDGFITKPVEPDYLVGRVGSYVRRARNVGRYLTRDSLTGVLNHAELLSRVSSEVARAAREGGQLCFAMLDVDHFKSVNDTYGHQLGDTVLRSLANLLRGRLRVSDVVGRYGGEEFGIILPGATTEDALALIDGLRRSFKDLTHRHPDGEFHVTFSAGVAHYPTCADAADLCGKADAAVYSAKRAGRDRVVAAPVTSQATSGPAV